MNRDEGTAYVPYNYLARESLSGLRMRRANELFTRGLNQVCAREDYLDAILEQISLCCQHCGERQDLHADGTKCLFHPTSFEATKP